MKRSNRFELRPRSENERAVLVRWLDASAALWNETTYARRIAFFSGDSIWDVDTGSLEGRYTGILSSSVAQQVIRKNTEAWRSFLSLTEKYSAGTLDEKPSPPGYWGNDEDGRILRSSVRKDQYTLEFGRRYRLEIPIGAALKADLGLHRNQRLRLEVAGQAKWTGEQNRLEIVYDDLADTFRASQPVTVDASRLDASLASREAALDVGANTLVACTVSNGSQYLYAGRPEFTRFRDTTERIAQLQSLLGDGRESSKQIERLYRKRTNRRDHLQDALVRDLVDRLSIEGVETVYVGDLRGVLSRQWSTRVNEKTHAFWGYRRLLGRFECVCEEYGIRVEGASEAWTSRECPACGEREETIRHGDSLTCSCGFEGHADLVASETFLTRQGSIESTEAGSMARPVYLKWDNHDWRDDPSPPSILETTTNEAYTNRSTAPGGNVALGASQIG